MNPGDHHIDQRNNDKEQQQKKLESIPNAEPYASQKNQWWDNGIIFLTHLFSHPFIPLN